MTEAEEKKLEVAGRREDRKDGEKDMGEDPTETTEGKRRDGQDEEIPAWADALMKRLDAIERRPMEAADRKDRKDGDEKEHDAGERAAGMEEEKRRLEDRKDRRDESEEKRERDEKEGGHKANEERWAKEREDRKDRKDEGDTDRDTDREDRARRDAQILSDNRRTSAKIAELESKLSAVYKEPSMEDRNALAETRARADGIYQALTGQTASSPMPGENPISYRKRIADGLRKYSDRMKEVRVDALTGEAFNAIEDIIYADAQAAIRSDAVIPEGQLRKIVRMDRGREKTEYVGDPSVTWGPFSAGAVMSARLLNPSATKH